MNLYIRLNKLALSDEDDTQTEIQVAKALNVVNAMGKIYKDRKLKLSKVVKNMLW